MANGEYDNISKTSANIADGIVARNRWMILSDMLQLGPLFKGTKFIDDIQKAGGSAFKAAAKETLIQAPTEAAEEMIQGAMTNESIYQGKKEGGFDVSDYDPNLVTRAIDYLKTDDELIDEWLLNADSTTPVTTSSDE